MNPLLLFKSLLIPIIIILLVCSELSYTPYDKGYVGDYSFSLQADNDTLYPFFPYHFKYTSGSDSFTKFLFYADSSGIIDTNFFNINLLPDSLGFYFTSPFIGTVGIIGVRPNMNCDTFQYEFYVKKPFEINYTVILPGCDTVQLYLLNSFDISMDCYKKVIWFLDSFSIDTLSPYDTLVYPLSLRKDHNVSVKCFDWQNNCFSVDPYTIHENRESQMSVFAPASIISGDSVHITFRLKDHKGDTGTLKINYNGKLKSVPLYFGESDTLSLKTCLGIAEKPGTLKFEAVYINSMGIPQKRNVAIFVEPSYLKNIISGVILRPSVIYDKESVTISVQVNLTPSGKECDRYYWSFDGDTIWDTITSMPKITRKFTGDSLRLAVLCSAPDKFFSDIFRKTIAIDPGIPVISDLLIPDEPLYYGKSLNFKIWASDNQGGMVDSFKIQIINSKKDTFVNISDKSDISISVDSEFCGNVSVSAQVRDSSGHWSQLYKAENPVNIDRGFPIIYFLKFTDTVWLVNPAYMHFGGEDLNGTLTKAIIDWDDSIIDTIEINNNRFSGVFKHTYKIPGNKIRNVKASFIDNDNLMVKDSIRVLIHEGNPMVKAVTSSLSHRQNNIVYVRDEQNPNNRKPVFDGRISFSIESSDSNGVVVKHYCDIDSPFSIEGAIGQSFSDLMQFEFCDNDSWFFTSKHPLVKTVLFAVDNDGLCGSDTFFISIDRPPSSDLEIMLPADGDTIITKPINFIWSGGIDNIDSLNTRFALTLKYHFDSLNYVYKDSLFWDGLLKDFKDPGTVSLRFKIPINEDIGNHLTDITPVKFRIIVSDRLGQRVYGEINCFEE